MMRTFFSYLFRAGPKTGSATQEVSPPAKFRQKLSEGVAVVGLAPQLLSSSQNAGWVLGCALIGLLYIPGSLLLAQERPGRNETEENRRESPRRDREKESRGESAREKSPDTSNGRGMGDIQESWMKEIRGAGAPDREAKDEGAESSGRGDSKTGETPPDAAPQPGSVFAGGEGPSFIGLLVRFVLIAGIMGGGLYLFVRFMKKKTGIVEGQGGPIEVIASVPLMPGKFLQIVDLAGQLMVLGISESGVRLVHLIDSATTAEKIRLWHQSRPRASAASLLETIQRSVKQGDFRLWGGERSKDRPDFLGMLNGDVEGKKMSDEVPAERLSELLKRQGRKIPRPPGTDSTET